MVQHRHHHRSFLRKNQNSSIKKRRSCSVVHVTVRQRRQHHASISNTKEIITHPKNIVTISSSYSRRTKATLSDKKGLTVEHHRKPKKKRTICFHRCCVLTILLSLALMSIIAAALLILLIEPKTTTRNQSNLTAVLRWNKTGITIAGITGSPGNSSTQLNGPVDIFLDDDYNLYIVDQNNYRIQKFPHGSFTAQTVAGTGMLGNSLSQFNSPSRVILDTNGDMYISDTGNHRVLFWPQNAAAGRVVAGVTSTSGIAYNRLYSQYGIALHPTTSELYIADYGNSRIMSYAQSATNGTLIFGNMGAGTNRTQLKYPVGIHFDAYSNSLIIANHIARNILQYKLGAIYWELLAGNINGSLGSSSTALYGPTEAIYDPMGNLYVADRDNQRIQFFYQGQINGSTIAGMVNTCTSSADKLCSPWSLRLDRQLNLYVTDTGNHRIQKFLRY